MIGSAPAGGLSQCLVGRRVDVIMIFLSAVAPDYQQRPAAPDDGKPEENYRQHNHEAANAPDGSQHGYRELKTHELFQMCVIRLPVSPLMT